MLHLTSVSLDELLDIYISHTNNFRDKERLWLEMLDLIEDKDKSLIERHKKILNSKIATNESREIDKLYYQYKDLDSESFVTSAGEIYFDNSNFQFIFLPESDKVAYIRIGKTQSTERSEIIESF
ncbi:MAG: hypothetical protein IPN49_08225 [Saprospiraceae bacterium]|nr:hypothetical protein [Saprospiraceae bacterium]